MLDVTYFLENNFSHCRDSPEMQLLLAEHYAELVRNKEFFYNANVQQPLDSKIQYLYHVDPAAFYDKQVQCLFHLDSTSFDHDIEPWLRSLIPISFQHIRYIENDLHTYRDLGLVVSTIELC